MPRRSLWQVNTVYCEPSRYDRKASPFGNFRLIRLSSGLLFQVQSNDDVIVDSRVEMPIIM